MIALVRMANSQNWLIGCVADRMRPSCIPISLSDVWRTFVWSGCMELISHGYDLFTMRWDCVKNYAERRMERYLLNRPTL